MGPKRIRVLIADDHGLVRTFLRDLIGGAPDMELVAEAEDGQEALDLVESRAPDVALVDLAMPGVGGLEFLETIRERGAPLRVLALTMHEDPRAVRKVLRAGGAGFLGKNSSPERILEAIRTVHQGRSFLEVPLGEDGLNEVLRPSEPPGRRAAAIGLGVLSERERQVLACVARGLTNRQIAEHIHVGVKSVETYRSRLQRKLGVRGRAELVRVALEAGMLEIEES